ncbi:MAG: sugar ABC transporter permease [Burkholderiales bacterium]|nr:sugar ABC transporter permease [Burkholderiales bacterium]
MRSPFLNPQRARRWAPYLFIAPFFALFATFGLFPLLFSIWLSLHQWEAASGLASMRWVGLDNYVYAITDPWFTKSLANTLWYAVVSGVPQHLVALPLAFFIHSTLKKSRNAVIGAYFVPYITSSVAIALIFSTLFSREAGIVNQLIGQPIDWLGRADTARPAIAFVVFWRYLGWNIVLYLSALQVIDPALYEAAALDGASRWQQFRHITLPLVRPMMYFAITLTIIGNLQLFEEPFILVPSDSGVVPSVMTTAMFMYRLAFADGDFGTASAVSWLLFLLIGALAWGNARLFGRQGGGDVAR